MGRGLLISYLRVVLLYDFDEDDEEGEQNQRLDESQSHEQCDLNAGTSGRVAGQSFASRRGYASLAKSAQRGGKGHREAGSNRHPVRAAGGSSFPTLGKRRHGK